MATLATLRGRVRSNVRDVGAFVTDADIDAWINEAQVDLCARLEILQNEATGNFAGSSLLTLPPSGPEAVRIISLRLGSGDDVEFVDHDTFYAWFDTGADPAHTIGIVFGTEIQVYPTPESGTAYILRYSAIPPVQTSLEDMLVPTQHHARMIAYASSRAYAKEDEPGKSDREMALYLEGLPGPALGLDKLQPGPFTMQFEPGPVDLDSRARHI